MDKESNALYKRLDKENKSIVRKIGHYLETRNINEIACEDIISDIVGMALEYQERGELFSEVIGDDPEYFCRELIMNSPKQSFVERLLHFCRWWFLFSAFLMPLLYILKLFFPTYTPGEISGLVYSVRLSFPLKYYILLFILIVGLFLIKKNTYKPMKYVLTPYIAALMLFYIFSDSLLRFVVSDIRISVNVLTWFVFLAALTLTCDLGKRLAAITVAYRKKKIELKNNKKEDADS